MTGTILNAIAIVVGAIVGLVASRPMSAATQQAVKLLLGGFTVYVGLNTTWRGLNGTFLHGAGQLGIALLAMLLGNATGKLLRVQKAVNKLGQYAKQSFSAPDSGKPRRWSEGFITCSILYCVAPIAILGALQDGLTGNWRILGIKAVMDGFAAMAFVGTFGWSVLLSVVPVVAYQGTISLLGTLLSQSMPNPAMQDALTVTTGLLVFSVALVILEVKRVELADYLPSLAYAPLLAWLFN